MNYVCFLLFIKILREGEIAAGNFASGVRPLGYSGLAPLRGRGVAATFPATSQHPQPFFSRISLLLPG